MLLILLRAVVLLYSTPFYLNKHKPRAVSQIEKYYPQTSRLVLKKVELMKKHQPYQIRNPRFEDDGEGGESYRAEKEEERQRPREERKQGHQSNDQRKIACTRTSAAHTVHQIFPAFLRRARWRRALGVVVSPRRDSRRNPPVTTCLARRSPDEQSHGDNREVFQLEFFSGMISLTG